MNLREYMKVMWDEGLFKYYENHLHMNEQQILNAVEESRHYVESKERAKFFPGFIDFLKEFKRRGGIIEVVTFGREEAIYKHYKALTNDEIKPDIVFGWEKDKREQCKPYAYPVEEAMRRYNLNKEDVVVIDDMPAGIEMAHNAGVTVVGAMYGEGHEVLEEDMKKICDRVFDKVEDFYDFVLN